MGKHTLPHQNPFAKSPSHWMNQGQPKILVRLPSEESPYHPAEVGHRQTPIVDALPAGPLRH